MGMSPVTLFLEAKVVRQSRQAVFWELNRMLLHLDRPRSLLRVLVNHENRKMYEAQRLTYPPDVTPRSLEASPLALVKFDLISAYPRDGGIRRRLVDAELALKKVAGNTAFSEDPRAVGIAPVSEISRIGQPRAGNGAQPISMCITTSKAALLNLISQCG